jgi:N-acetylneuraminic acid mutarotase
MTPPISIDGTDITGATIDGTDVQEITVDGQTVFSASQPKIFTLGGDNGSDDDFDGIFEFDPSAGTSTTKTPTLTQGSRYATAAAAGGKIYYFGGRVSGYEPDVFEYDPVADAVSTKTSLSEGLGQAVSENIGGKIYVIGGINDSFNRVDTIREYDPSADSFTTLNETLPNDTNAMSSSVVDDKIYIFGGSASGVGIVDDIVEYDPGAGSVSTMNSKLPTATTLACAETFDDKIYHFGGTSSTGVNTPIDDIYEFDPLTDSISTLTQTLPSNLAESDCVAVNGSIYILGGDTSNNSEIDDIVEYNPSTNTISTLSTTLPQNLYKHAAVAVDV